MVTYIQKRGGGYSLSTNIQKTGKKYFSTFVNRYEEFEWGVTSCNEKNCCCYSFLSYKKIVIMRTVFILIPTV